MATSTEHRICALLRAHLAAASDYRHLTHRCPVCHRLLRLTLEPVTASRASPFPVGPPVLRAGRQDGAQEGREARVESPCTG
ncbi:MULTISPECIES: DUF6274 family protein [unclassified Streptomyces]|uniref:DUF6274 family protein n=1 Tax=unclassified Streptomyces TaxID=2593676 RepID=UPI0036E25C32